MTDYEYIVVGAGPGGGTLAARLAEYGHRVLLLEAGGDPRTEKGSNYNPNSTAQSTLPDDYDVPAFHAQASENSGMKWDFYVRHYQDDAQQQKDSKYIPDKDGVLYPRSSGLGGCSAHNAMITIYPHNEDWDYIAKTAGDDSWSSTAMRRYFERLENCQHRPFWRLWSWLGINPTRHGFRGWLHTENSIPDVVLDDESLLTVIVKSAIAEIFDGTASLLHRMRWFFLGKGDPNDWRLVRDNATGVRYLPMATKNHRRMGARERVLDVMARKPDHLFVELNALVTRVLFEDKRAVGVEYQKGAGLYKAHTSPSDQPGEVRQVRASREVILCGGTYNTPQLLMLSGIGPAEELAKHDIKVVVDLPGVGCNLQDRYEIGVVNRMNFKEWWCLQGARFEAGDPQYEQWQNGEGVYTTNGVVSAVFLTSPGQPLPDLFCFALIGPFRGYRPGYSAEFATKRNCLTWSILKAHTVNNAGRVRLRSNDPRDTPLIDFHYFDEGTDVDGRDLASMVWGVKFVRRLTKRLLTDRVIAEEECPGEHVQSDDEIADYVKSEAWGHHASGTCAIGSVVNSSFEVQGVRGLRVVDASVFPRIPGFFIASAVYMIGEKAADVIAAAAKSPSSAPATAAAR
ncbi:MAG TPA: GMC oxidoreductase [Thermoanaerobaculia bacterium]